MTRKAVEGATEIYYDTEDDIFHEFKSGEMRPDLSRETWVEYVGSGETNEQLQRAKAEFEPRRQAVLKERKGKGGYEGI